MICCNNESDNRGERNSGSGLVSFLAGVGVGAVVAAAAAVLYAPQAGAETRQDIIEAARQLRQRADSVVEQLRHAASEVTTRLRQDLDAVLAEANEAAAARKAELEKQVRGA
jgi:gas vesicle protein